MVFACDFDAIPRGILSAGSVRFFPRVSGFTAPIVTYAWTFGDTGTSALASPIHAYPVRTTVTSYTVGLTVTDAAGNTATKSRTTFIAGGVSAAAPLNDGTYQAVSILIYDATNSMLITRRPTALSNFYLMYPSVTNNLDKIGTATFSLLDVGTSTVTEQSLNAAGKSVIIFAGRDLVFSGKIRRSTQNTQMGYDSTTGVYFWDVECDSDYASMKRINVAAASLDANGNALVDTPGNIARKILAPDTGELGDARGVISCVDPNIRYQLNNQNNLQSAGDRYKHMETLRLQSNYDIRTRMDFMLYQYSTYAAKVVTITGATFTVNEFIGCWLVFPLTLLNGGAANNGEVRAYGKITANTANTITVGGTLYGSSSIPATLDNVMIVRWPVADFAQDLTEPSALTTFSVNKTVFDYSDNDDQKKEVTKVVCQGKDLQGVTISVALAGCHAYDNNEQFFNDCTFITRLSEGYVYQNTRAGDSMAVTVILQSSGLFTVNYPSYPTEILFANGNTPMAVGANVTLSSTGTLPPPFAAGTTYYVVDQNNNSYCKLSLTRGGTAIAATGLGTGLHTIVLPYGGLKLSSANSGPAFPDGAVVSISGTTQPTGANFGGLYWIRDSMTGDYFVRMAFTLGGTPVTFTSAGSGIILYSVNKVINGHAPNSTIAYVWLRGWGYGILINEGMYLVSPNGLQMPFNTYQYAAPTEVTMNDGTKCTKIRIDAWKMPATDYDFSGRGFCLAPLIWVAKASRVYTSGTVSLKVGEETLTVTGTTNHGTYGQYLVVTASTRIPSASLISYPHGVGALVAKTNYTEASPEALSPIAVHGVLLETLIADQNVTYGDLDTYATLVILGKSYYPKATCWGPFNLVYVPKIGEFYGGYQQITLSVAPRPGQRVSVKRSATATAEEWQIVSVTINYDRGMVSLILGDFEKNLFTTLQADTSSLNFTVS